MQAFKLKYIYDKLREDELETHVYVVSRSIVRVRLTHSFHKWIRQMDTSDSDILSFLNAQGIIPPEAEISKREEARKAAQASATDAANDEVAGGEAPAAKKQRAEDAESDDEEVDQDLLKRGELEG